jgi:hypothetical protein
LRGARRTTPRKALRAFDSSKPSDQPCSGVHLALSKYPQRRAGALLVSPRWAVFTQRDARSTRIGQARRAKVCKPRPAIAEVIDRVALNSSSGCAPRWASAVRCRLKSAGPKYSHGWPRGGMTQRSFQQEQVHGPCSVHPFSWPI